MKAGTSLKTTRKETALDTASLEGERKRILEILMSHPYVLEADVKFRVEGENRYLLDAAVVLKQEHGFTFGALANHVWSFAGDDDRSDISATFLQPFFTYTTKTFTSFGINTESTYNWETDEWSVPVNLTVTQLLKIGPQPISLCCGRLWCSPCSEPLQILP